MDLRLATLLVLSTLLATANGEPLDPLTAEERRAAERIATDDAKVRELLGGGKTRVVYVEFIAPKPEGSDVRDPQKEPPLDRHAEVVLYRFEGDVGVRALVSLGRARVVEVLQVDGASVPLVREDLSEALNIALESAQVRELLGAQAREYRIASLSPGAADAGPVVRGLLVHATTRSDPCWRRRCIQLLFQTRPGTYMTDTVIVDLTGARATIQRGLRGH